MCYLSDTAPSAMQARTLPTTSKGVSSCWKSRTALDAGEWWMRFATSAAQENQTDSDKTGIAGSLTVRCLLIIVPDIGYNRN
jgi:hypothetical protein